MRDIWNHSILTGLWRGSMAALAVIAMSSSHAATLWTGPTINFTQFMPSDSDTVLPGKVVLTRGSNDVLYNTAAGETSAGDASPAGTEWGFGLLKDFAKIQFQSLESMRNGDLKTLIVGHPMVMHIISEDIYLTVTFSQWGQNKVGGFAYTRSTPAVVVAPAVSIASPAAGSTFVAPASFNLTSTATVSGGTVTNVEYFAGATSLGAATASPFTVAASLPTPGPYALTAVATAGGVSSTSAVVNITVTTASGPISLSAPSFQQGAFSFSYSAEPGQNYLIQASLDLLSWAPVATNTASANPAVFSETAPASPARYYRVGRLTSP